MKRKQSIVIWIAIGLFMIMLYACNSNKEQSGNNYLNVKIKVGVVMKSGDVKNAARQDLIISKSDAVKLWETIKRNTIRSRNVIEEETKVELEYQTKLDAFQNIITNNENLLKRLRADLESKIYSIVKRRTIIFLDSPTLNT